MKALIDGDAVAYMSGFKCQRKVWVAEYEGNRYNLDTTKKADIIKHIETLKGKIDKTKIKWTSDVSVEPENHAYHSVNLIIKRALLDTNSEEYLVAVGNPERENNFRHHVATIQEYKGNREEGNVPVLLPQIKEFLIERWGALVVDGHETDDELMIEHHKDLDDTIVCTIDKDFKNAARLIYNLRTKEIIRLTYADNLHHFWTQILYGDKCDNIPGLRRWLTPKKFGPKGIEAQLSTCMGADDPNKYETRVWELYKAHHYEPKVSYKTEKELREKYLERLNEIKTLLWIKTE